MVYIGASTFAVISILMVAWIVHAPQLGVPKGKLPVTLFALLGRAELIGLLLVALLIGYAFCSAGRIELRGHGFIISGVWLPWSSVESYAWQDTGSESVALRVRSRKWLLFSLSSTLEIILPATQKASVDAILKSQLAERPAS